MSVKCPGCGALIADLPIRTWEMKIGRKKSASVRIKAYGCPKCLRKFKTGERVSGAPKT
jgi:hypothetical protein